MLKHSLLFSTLLTSLALSQVQHTSALESVEILESPTISTSSSSIMSESVDILDDSLQEESVEEYLGLTP